jgi:amino acid adenylation domain-containing protein
MKVNGISGKRKLAASQNTKEKDYWLKKLSGHLLKSNFPYDYNYNKTNREVMEAVKFKFEGEISAKMLKLSNKSHQRLFMILVAGLVVLLEKYTGNKDILLGTPIYKQEIEGEFINTVLVLRNILEAKNTFKDLLLQVRQTISEAVENQNYPMEALLYKLNMSLTGNDFPLFDVAALLENIQDKSYLKHIKCNMIVSFLQTGQYIEGKLEYNRSRYENATIQRIAGHFQQFFRNVLFNINLQLTHMDILSEQEKNQVLLDFNNTRVDYPKNKTIHRLLEAQVEKTPDHTAIIFQDKYLSYRELNEKANQLARLLRAKGVKQNNIVGIIFKPSPEMIVGIIAVLKAGGAYMPIDPGHPPKRILSVLKNSGAAILLTKEKIVNHIAFTSLQNINACNITPLVTLPPPQIKDFNALPLPDRSLVDYEKYHHRIGIAMVKHSVSIQATRGCPYNCAFCHKIWPKKHIYRDAENIFEEIRCCYNAGIKRFAFIDDVFNLQKDNVSRLMWKIIKNGMDVRLFFPNGLRGDILNKESIDLMMEAGTVNIDLALESASPRIQELINKNLDLEKFKENALYIIEKYPHLLLEMELMIGFPTETEEEALMTLDFLKNLHWVDFPNLNILKIYPNTDMYRLAIEKGIDKKSIERSTNLAYHELPETLPFSKSNTRQLQMLFMNEYFLSKQRLLHVLPYQLKILTREELIQKYNSYLPMEIKSFSDILAAGGISEKEPGNPRFLPDHHMAAPGFGEKIKHYFPVIEKKGPHALRVLLLDLSQLFLAESKYMLYDMIEEPLGLMYLLTYLNKKFAGKIRGKIAKSRTDFNSYEELKVLTENFKPDLIGIRTLSYYKEFFHKTVSLIRQWGVNVPIIAGGPYATSDYKSILRDKHVDLAVLGEGEFILTRLIEKILDNDKKLPPQEVLESIQGVAFVKDREKHLQKETNRDIIFLDNIPAKLAEYPRENLHHINQPGDLLYLISTSGSTGVPKNPMIEHRNLINLLNFQFCETTVQFTKVLQFASIGFDVSAQEIFSTLLAGGELYLIDKDMKSEVLRLFDLIRANHISTVFWPPAFLKAIFSEVEFMTKFPKSIRHIITAGEQLIVTEPIRRYLRDNHVYLHNHYGPSETHVVTNFTMTPADRIAEIPPIGKPISNTKIYILDENQKPKPIGTTGELYIAGDNVGRGYLDSPELTHEKFCLRRPGGALFEKTAPVKHLDTPRKNFLLEGTGGLAPLLYRTGDLARWLPDGNIEFIGRVDNQVKVRGFRIELGEIETQLMAIDFIKEAVLIDITNVRGEKYLCAYIVSQREVDTTEIKKILSDHLPDYMIPLYFIRLGKIPVTPNGKVDKKALPLPGLTAEETYIAPRNAMEKKLVDIWSEVLGIEKDKIGIESDFFELGGHSLKATILITRIHKAFNVKVALGQLFEQPTIRGLTRYLKAGQDDQFTAVASMEKKEYYPLSSAQKRLYILQHMKIGDIAYNNPMINALEGNLKIEKLESSLKKMIKRHETLRTSFEMVDQQPFQRTHPQVEFSVVYNEMTESAVEKRAAAFVKPFDLSQPPLLRVELIKIGESRFILMFDIHHIITDGTSGQVFLKEFMALYGGKRLPPLRIQYKDFSGWQNRKFESEEIKKQQEYWLSRFETGEDIPVLNIPTDYRRIELQSIEGSYLSFHLGSEETGALMKLAKEKNVTLYMVLLSIFNVLLSKISGQEDIIIGTPIAGRRHADLQYIIGMFVNTLVMRNYPHGEKTFAQFLEEVRKQTMGAFENQDYPFEELVDRLAIKRDTDRNPLFEVMFSLQNMSVQQGDIPAVEIPGLKIMPYEHETGHADTKFDMGLSVTEIPTGLLLMFTYNILLYRKETIERYITYFKLITASIIQNTGKKISAIEILTPEEKNRILFDFNKTGTPFPGEKTIHELFEKQVKKTPDRTALVSNWQSADGKKGERPSTITYKKLNEKSNQLAHLLRERGVQPDTIVGIMVERSNPMIIAIWAVLKAGGGYLPIDLDYPRDRIDYMLKDSGAKVLLTSPGGKVTDESIELIDIFNLSSSLTSTSTCRAGSTNLAYIIYTSGSTGKAKGVMVNRGNLLAYIRAFLHEIQPGPTDVTILEASFSFDAFVEEAYPFLFIGGKICVAEKYVVMDVYLLKEFILRNNITIISCSPLLLNQMNRLSGFESVHSFLSGADVLKGEYFNRLSTFSKIYNIYGPTETTVAATYYKLPPQFNSNIPLGKPIANYQVYIINKDQRLQAVGLPGELCIGGDGVTRGYLNNPELTNSKFQIPNKEKTTLPHSPHSPHSPIYRTGDLARWLPDGNIEFLGRIDNQLKLRGYRIELGEIENLLMKHHHIKEAVVLARSEGKQDKYLCAYIVTGKELRISELREFLAKHLPEYMLPSYLMQVEKIPLTPNGKIDRSALPEPEIIRGPGYAAPRDETEKKLASIWGEVLGVKDVGIEDNFFELGGHSLKATILVARIHKELNIRLPLAAIFKTPVIKGLAESIKEKKEERFASIEPVEKKEYYLLSSAQQRLYILQQVELDSTVYNMPIFISLPGEPDIEKLTDTCKLLIHRHESLRTSFESVEDEPVQKVHNKVKFEIEYYNMKEVEVKGHHSSFITHHSFVRPFDLSHAPLLRVGLMKLEENQHILMVDMHHIISDGTSHQILTKDLTAIDKGEPLPLLRLQYKDFSEWQNSKKEMENLKQQEHYWLKEFDGQIPLLEMPLDYERSDEMGFEGSTLAFKIPPPLTGKLRNMASQFGVTLMMLLLSAYNILLSKYTGQEDLVVGTVTAGRRHADLENIMGFFVNMLAIRTTPGKNKRFSQYLPEVKEKALNAFENQDYPFEELVSKLRVQRVPGRHPLIDTVFVLADARENPVEQEKQPTQTNTSDMNTNLFKKSHFDLMLHATAAEHSINMVFEYSTRLFKEETILEFSKYYLEILRQAAANKDIKLQEIKVSHDLQASKIDSIKDNKDDWDI